MASDTWEKMYKSKNKECKEIQKKYSKLMKEHIELKKQLDQKNQMDQNKKSTISPVHTEIINGSANISEKIADFVLNLDPSIQPIYNVAHPLTTVSELSKIERIELFESATDDELLGYRTDVAMTVPYLNNELIKRGITLGGIPTKI